MLQAHLHFGKVGQKRPEEGAQLERVGVDDRTNDHIACHLAAKPPCVVDQLHGIEQGALRQGKQRAAFLGEHHASGLALKQQHAEFLLQGFDLFGHGRLRQVQLLCGAREMPQTGHSQKGTQLIDFHGLRCNSI